MRWGGCGGRGGGKGWWKRGRWRGPEGSGEGEVDFLEAAVGDVVDCLGNPCWERWCEGWLVAFEPA